MFQDLVERHIQKSTPFYAISPIFNANRHFRNCIAVGNLRRDISGIYNGTAGANDWTAIGCMVTDPETRGPMVFSYEATLVGNVAPIGICPLFFDRQAVTPAAVSEVFAFGSNTDFAWNVPQSDWTAGACFRLQVKGRALVDTRITSATPGITTREFGVSLGVRLPAGAFEFSYSVQIELYAQSQQFFQPLK